MFDLFFRPKCQGISPENMAKHMVQSVPPFSIDIMEINWIWVQVKSKSKKNCKTPKDKTKNIQYRVVPQGAVPR